MAEVSKPPGKPGGKRSGRKKKPGLGRWVVLALVVLGVAYGGVLEYQRPHVDGDALRFDEFVGLVVNGNIHSATVLDADAYIVGTYTPPEGGEELGEVSGLNLADDHGHGSMTPGDASGEEAGDQGDGQARYNAPLVRNTQGQVLQLLVEEGVPTTVNQQVGKQLAQFASMLLPGVMLVVLFIYLILSYRSGTGLFGVKSGARRITAQEGGATFADVAGQDAALAELVEVTEFLADPDRFAAVGAVAPKGILLYGPPGCGKTLLARALAGEAGASFFSISGSDFVELYAGVGAARVRELFAEAREAAPAVIFIDELDSIGRARSTGGDTVASKGEQEQALNQILAEMDGFSSSQGLVVLAATNRPDVLDQALLRPGRFDRTVGLERPDEAGRLAILRLHTAGKSVGGDVDLSAVARRAIGLTGADLAAVMNEAALRAARAGRPVIGQADVDEAVQGLLEAPERQRRLSLRERSIGKRHTGEQRVTLADVAGVDDAVEELAEVIAYLGEPDRFAAMGARGPRGILLSGPPGCGKTLLARALAGEANAAFLSAAGSEFVEVYVGKGAARVRDLFAEAASLAPAIVFLDEIDAVGARRSAEGGSGQEREQTLNQILVELDGFEPTTAVVVIAATNRPDILDPALVRPGRFDRHVVMALPDRDGRHAILDLHATDKPLDRDVDLGAVAGMTEGFSGAALANVLNDAALLATRRNRTTITTEDIDAAVDRAAMGVGSRRWIMTPTQRRVAAYREAGRGLVAHTLTGAAPHKLALTAGGRTLDMAVDQLDPLAATRDGLVAHMACLLGARAGEQLGLGQASGASSGELARATDIAQAMVCQLGMSPTLGLLAHPHNGSQGVSEQLTRTIEAEKRALVEEAYELACSVLASDRDTLERLAAALLEHETVRGEQLADLAGRPVDRPGARAPTTSP